MPFELLLAIRYLKAKRENSFISIITLISIIGVMAGVMALIIVLSVMNGFRSDLLSKILGVNSHIMVLSLEGGFNNYREIEPKLKTIKEVVAFTPFVYSQVMIKGSNSSSGAILTGIEPETATKVIDINRMIKKGSLKHIKERIAGMPGIVLGSELSKRLAAFLGDTVTLISPEGRLTPVGRVPNTKRCRVVGIFESGMYEYDSSMAYILLKEAQDFLDMGDRITGIEVRIKDPHRSDIVAKRIHSLVGYPFIVKDWKEMNKSLFSALKLEKMTMFVILTMIVLVGALNIISTLILMVTEKRRDIAILRAMGASAKNIMRIFVIQGLLVGIIGTIMGLMSGLGICYLLKRYKFISLPADVYYISKLPVRVQLWDIIIVCVAAVIISFIATIYPARHASKLNPVDILRYE
ncbi:MAG: lipoprotein-releasing ABC transporter permease subunit [Deltaproteobacteria bacterium]|nr:MAG: lipoprotein-releasing ABC transporter permease subunit [Deltaproteobacteria bacterium]